MKGSESMLLKNANVLTDDFKFHKCDILTDNGKIKEIGNISGEGENLEGKYVIPGLTDIHTHGAVGTDTMDKDFDFAKWQKYLFANGVTTFFPTTASGSDENITACLTKLSAIDDVRGINLEGPYINPAKKGAHAEETLREGTMNEFSKYMKLSGNKIRLTTIAPEYGNNLEFIKELKQNFDITVALGHSTADYDEAAAGFAAGANEVTHMFNAMEPFLHRAPGLPGAAFDNENVRCEVISDGIHLHPSVVRTLYKILGSDRMLLISDSMAATGLADGKYTLAGSMDVVVKDGIARTLSGAIAGSTRNLMQMVRSAVSFGIPVEQAIKMATLTPCRAASLGDIGSISVGKNADLVICTEKLDVIKTIKNGAVVFA